jgi:hypothetical protein
MLLPVAAGERKRIGHHLLRESSQKERAPGSAACHLLEYVGEDSLPPSCTSLHEKRLCRLVSLHQLWRASPQASAAPYDDREHFGMILRFCDLCPPMHLLLPSQISHWGGIAKPRLEINLITPDPTASRAQFEQ